MLKRILLVVIIAAVAAIACPDRAAAAPPGQPSDWQRFYHYPYVYYPHSFQKPRVNNSLYYKYQPSQRIPVYNRNWYNFYPSEKPYHSGHHYILDVF
jgi:hypothetical protein